MDATERDTLVRLGARYAETYSAALEAEKVADQAAEEFARVGVQFITKAEEILLGYDTPINEQEAIICEAINSTGADYNRDPQWKFFRDGFDRYRVRAQRQAARLN